MDRFRSYFERSPHGVFITDNTARYVEVNPAACRITGYDEAELLGMPFTATLPDDYLNAGLVAFSRVQELGSCQAELPFIGKGGRRGWWSIDAVRLSATRFIGFVTDVTARKKLEEECQRQQAELDVIFRAAPDLHLTLDEHDAILGCRARNTADYYLQPRDFLGKRMEEVLPPEVGAKFHTGIEQLRACGAAVEFEYPLSMPSGTEWYEARLDMLPHQQISVLVRNITEPKRNRERKLAHLAKLERLSEQSMRLAGEPAAVFAAAVRLTGELFQTRIAFLAEVVGKELLFRAVCIDGNVHSDTKKYPLAVTPCATVVAAKSLRVFGNVAECFPQATVLRDHNILTYCGVPVLDRDENVVATLCLLDDKAREFTAEDQHILRLISQRLGLELERDKSEAARRHAEELQHKSNARLRLVLDKASEGFFVLDRNGVYTDINSAGAAMVGRTPEGLIGRRLLDEFPEAAGSVWVKSYAQVMQSGKAMVVEEYYPALKRCFLARIYPYADGVSVLFNDVTERKQAEEALQTNKRRLQIAQGIAKLGYWELDIQSSALWWSAEVYKLFEMDPGEFGASYEAFLNTVHPDDRERVNAAYAQSLKDRTPYQVTHRLLFPDGRVKFVEERCETDFGPDHTPLFSRGTVQDVTERMHLKETFRSHSQVLMAMHEAVSFVDERGSITFTNRALDGLFGYEPGELIGKPVTILNDASPAENDRLVSNVMSAVVQHGTWAGEFRNRKKDGTVFWTEAQISQVAIEGETCFVCVQEDITARKAGEEQLATLRQQLAHASRLTTLGQMAAGLAHELNQPLAALRLYTAAAAEIGATLESSRLQDCLKRIDDQSVRAAEIIRRMRAFANRNATQHLEVDLNRLIDEVLTILNHELRLARVRIEVNLDARRPRFLGDAIQIQQVLVNLLRNATDAMTNLDAEERMIRVQSLLDDESVCVRVSDVGCGIDPAAAAELFEPFRSTKPSGMGLGLTICRTIIEAHGGSISVSPNQPRGTSFVFSLPATSN